jgi:hypothetical protein
MDQNPTSDEAASGRRLHRFSVCQDDCVGDDAEVRYRDDAWTDQVVPRPRVAILGTCPSVRVVNLKASTSSPPMSCGGALSNSGPDLASQTPIGQNRSLPNRVLALRSYELATGRPKRLRRETSGRLVPTHPVVHRCLTSLQRAQAHMNLRHRSGFEAFADHVAIALVQLFAQHLAA